MKKFKLPTVPAIIAICLLAVVFSCQTNKNKTQMEEKLGTRIEVKDNGDLRVNELPKERLYINPNAGSICIGKTERTITISIERYNSLTTESEWELIDVYSKNDCLTSKWKNKTTNEEIESIGTYPPSKRLDLNNR